MTTLSFGGTREWGRMHARPAALSVMALLTLGVAACASPKSAAPNAGSPIRSFLGSFDHISRVASTVPANGDVNPYGVAVVPTTIGHLVAGDTLVSNFNGRANVQGTGTTIVQITPQGSAELFSHVSHLGTGLSCPGGVGLDSALGILPGGWVVVGSLPTESGGRLPRVDRAGCLIILDPDGAPVETISNKNLVGPWDMAVESTPGRSTLFVANALGVQPGVNSGPPVVTTSTVVRIGMSLSTGRPPTVASVTIVGSGFPWIANQAALVLGPTGLALGRNGTLYVDDTQRNTISAIPNAKTRTDAVAYGSSIISSGGALNAPLGMTRAPNGDLLVLNGNNGNAVEVTPAGSQIATKTLIRNGAGDLFGVALTSNDRGIEFGNDGANALDLSGADPKAPT
jgi:hypothetical protein